MQRWLAVVVAGLVLTLSVGVCGVCGLFEPIGGQASRETTTEVGGAPAFDQDLSLVAPPIVNPEFVAADKALLADDDVVIGVVVGDQSRAYLRSAFDDSPEAHVVLDELGSTRVAVTHCDRMRCTRVFAGDADEKLDVSTGGWNASASEMELVVSGKRYGHKSPDIPLNDVPFLETTWGNWRTVYPDTLVYVAPPSQRAQSHTN
jgi:hypothetical protein